MNYDTDPEMLDETVAAAAAQISAILAKGGGPTRAPAVEAQVGAVVDEVVSAAGGDAHALFSVTAELSKSVAFGARRLRSMRNAHLRSGYLDDAAVGIYELLVGDAAADAIEIGRRVAEAVRRCGASPDVESEALAGLAARIGSEASPQMLGRSRDAYEVAVIGGGELARLVPDHLPASMLPEFTRLVKMSNTPWAAQKRILKAANECVRLGLQGKQVTALVSRMLTEAAEPESEAAVAPSWHHPAARTPCNESFSTTATHQAA